MRTRGFICACLCGCLLSVPLCEMVNTANAYYEICNDTLETVEIVTNEKEDVGSPTMENISIDTVYTKPEDYKESITLKDEPYVVETEMTYYAPQYWSNLGYYDIIVEKHPVLVECSEEEIELLIRTMYLEAGAESDECIRAVTDVAFNQLNSGWFGSTLYEVLWHPGNYTETVPFAWTKEPSQRVRDIVMDVYYNGISLPSRILYYRNQYYHDTRWSIPEFTVDNVFFSSGIWN